jgi:L-alanine-DL-glutamate epimerase-like enolase superfamily enzyme
MKITDISIYLAKEWRTFLFVVIDTDEGIYGLGEAGITGRELAVQGAIEHFKPLLIGQDPFRTEHIWQMLFRGGFFPAQRILTAAIAAIDIALWDIKGKVLGVPVYQLLGGLARDKVMTYNHNVGETIEELVESCERSVEEGWKVIRWGLAHQ